MMTAMKTFLPRLVLLLGVLCFAAAAAHAEDLGAVKARIAQRLPKIDSLRKSGAIGENNRGFAEVRDGGGDAASVTAEENADRTVVYAALAKQTGSSADAV